ncbi:GMC oxidoreductase [Polyporus arcularius HHB13444]|uniref:GMC oxidoreductase n=1 Tax=Polyporus arcularius HHB13444 TaxID=1314778 RepID=A0A5C3NXP6_9APHY|nr:GMC oxidoreductase [Polyporus arcularius HHB13444]
MPKVLELGPADVGTPLPANSWEDVPSDARTYDFIIIGGGTAGCVLASRLSEMEDVSVLVIEQGPVADTWASRVPLISGNPYRSGSVAAQWWSLPMREANSRYLQVMRAEALGGTSRINGLLYTRGCPGEYNHWRDLGSAGWGYSDVEPYFVKSENTRSHPSSSFRGKEGVWHNRQFDHVPYKVVPFVHRAFHNAGIKNYEDINSPEMPAAGSGAFDIIEDGSYHRDSVDRAFLPGALTHQRRARLKICTNTLVTKIAVSSVDSRRRATGVFFEAFVPRKAGIHYYARARREVILCAGALGSPQLLMLSGIGPEDHLRNKGITPVHDLPAVGNYLQDHIGVPLTFQVPITDSLHELEVSPLKAGAELVKYVFTGRGMFSLPFQASCTVVPSRLLDADGSFSSKDPKELDASVPENRPEIELMHLTSNSIDYDIPGKGLFTLLVAHIRPKSYGSVRLATGNPRERPEVDLGFFSNPDDYVALRKGLRLGLRVAADVQKQGYPLEDLIVPEGKSDEDLDAFIRSNVRTVFHYTSTCRMGQQPHGERPSVVDAELRVHGVDGLRVCDASIFPEILGAHTMAPVVMVAEKCADMIKKDCVR